MNLFVNSFSRAVILPTAANKIGCMDTLRDYGTPKRDLLKHFTSHEMNRKHVGVVSFVELVKINVLYTVFTNSLITKTVCVGWIVLCQTIEMVQYSSFQEAFYITYFPFQSI